MNPALLMLIACMAPEHELSPYTVSAIVELESQWKPNAVGKLGEQGLLQLRPEFYRGPWNYADPETNLRLGLETLQRAKRDCPLQSPVDKLFIICHNRGMTGAARLTPDQALEDKYFLKFRRIREAHKAQRLFEHIRCR